MTRKILLLLTLLPLAISCDETEIRPTMDNYRLIKILNYSSTSASLPYSFVTFEYDDRGNLIKESMFDYPGTLFTYRLYEYSNNNKLRRKQTFDGVVGHLTLGGYVDYFYDNGNLIREEWYRADATLFYTVHNEFEGNNLSTTYKENDDLGIHHLYKYTYEKNRLVSEAVFMYDQLLDNFSNYFYDDENRLVKTQHFNQDSILISQIEKVYTGSDNLPDEELSFSANGELMSRTLLAYDGWGNPVGCSVDGYATCAVFTRKYNGKLLLEEIRYHPGFACAEWAVTRYEYEVR
jgi:hypothetical protein